MIGHLDKPCHLDRPKPQPRTGPAAQNSTGGGHALRACLQSVCVHRPACHRASTAPPAHTPNLHSIPLMASQPVFYKGCPGLHSIPLRASQPVLHSLKGVPACIPFPQGRSNLLCALSALAISPECERCWCSWQRSPRTHTTYSRLQHTHLAPFGYNTSHVYSPK